MDTALHDTPDYVARARSLGPLLAEAADEIERSRELPASTVAALIENGMFRLLQPRSLGGVELDPMTYIRVVEEIAHHDASTGWCVEQANGCSMVAAFLDPNVAKEIFGPSDGIVAWGPVGPAELRAAPAGFLLTGALEFRQRQSPCELAWRPCRRPRCRWRAAAPRRWRRNPAYPAVSKKPRHDHRYLACGRSARHRQRSVLGDRSLHSRALYCAARPQDRAAPAGSALPLQQQ